ncbi:hypothetical protein ACJW30_06G022300 [Castanea mollissima]
MTIITQKSSLLFFKILGFFLGFGKSIPIRSFSDEELKQATNNYDARLVIVQDELYWKWYKGSLDGRLVSIRKFEGGVHIIEDRGLLSNYTINDLVISANMSAHNNPLTWVSRLKISREIAHAISYLHTAFSRPIIHRDIDMRNIFLDQHDVAKLSNFELSISVPEGETHVHVDILSWYVGYMSPEYFATGKVTDKVDVYSFGALLLELVTGQNSNDFTQLNNGKCRCIVDPTILAGEGRASTIEQQLQAVVDLAFKCRKRESEIRPTMVDVTKELMRIERLVL